MACHDRLWTRYLRGRALMAMDAAGDAVMDLSRALDTIQKHGRRRKLETEVATHLREAEKRLRCCAVRRSSLVCHVCARAHTHPHTRARVRAHIRMLRRVIRLRAPRMRWPWGRCLRSCLSSLSDGPGGL